VLCLGAALGLLTVGTSVAASASSTLATSLTTNQTVDAYLAAHGVDPATALWQTGRENYVGTACPGVGWTCASPTLTPVVQEAPLNGINVYSCTTSGAARCFVVQVNGGLLTGSARQLGMMSGSAASPAAPPPGSNNMQVTCHQQGSGSSSTSFDSASCYSGTQVNSNGNNQATIQQTIQQQNTPTATASETAGYPTGCSVSSGTASSQTPLFQQNASGNNQITIQQQTQQSQVDTPTAAEQAVVCQSNVTGNNQATVQQTIQQQVNDASPAQDQEATQFACVVQDSASGQNQANVQQQQQQNEQTTATQSPGAGAVSQYQDNSSGPNNSCGNGSPDRTETTFPDLGAVIEQNESNSPATGSGQDQATVNQQWQETQQSTTQTGAVTQLQGPCCYGVGGSETDANQYSTGIAQANVHQADQQQQQAKTNGARDQEQYDAPHCCSNQGSNTKDQFTVNQQTMQNSDPGAFQQYSDNGDCTSSGGCSVNQNINEDGSNQSPPPCNNEPACEVDTTGGSGGGGETSEATLS
jgi:hypothetical protein